MDSKPQNSNGEPEDYVDFENQSPPTGIKKYTRAIPLVISLILLALLLHYFQGYSLLVDINPWIFLFALLLSFGINAFLGAYKWQQVMKLSNIKFNYWGVWKIWLALFPVTFFMPFQSGHFLYAVALKKAKNLGYIESFENVAYDKYLSLIGTFGLIAIGQVFLDRSHVLSNIWIFIGALGAVAFFLADDWALKILSRFKFVKKNSRLIHKDTTISRKLYLLIIAMIYQSSDMFSFYLACLAMGFDIPFLHLTLGVMPVVLLLSYVPVTVSGIGAREGLIALFLAKTLTYDGAIAAGLLVDMLEYLSPALIGLICLRHGIRILTKKSPPVEQKQ